MLANKKGSYILFAIFCPALIAMQVGSTTSFRSKLADYYIKNRDYDRAIATYRKILHKENLSAKYQTLDTERISYIYFTLGDLLLSKNRYVESVQMLKKIIEINPAYNIGSLSNLSEPEYYRKFGLALLRENLKDLAIAQFQKAIELEPENPFGHYQLALIYQRQGMEEGAIIQFKKAAEAAEGINQPADNPPAYLGDVYYNLALVYEKDGDIDKAKDYYRKAIRLDGSRIIEAYYRLSLEKELINLKPEYEVNHSFPNGLKLLGYSLNEKEFELFNRGKITFFWEVSGQYPEPAYENGELSDIYKIGNRLYKVKEVENLAPNFGFEVDSIGTGFPCGWKTDNYNAFTESHEIVIESLPSGKRQCLTLDNSRSERTNCQTEYIAIDANSFYLQAGWIKSIGGDAYLGRIWFDSEKDQNGYDYVVLRVRLPRWIYYSKVVVPQPDSAYCRLWLTNFMTRGKAYFDDVVFFKLELPRYF